MPPEYQEENLEDLKRVHMFISLVKAHESMNCFTINMSLPSEDLPDDDLHAVGSALTAG